MPIPALAAPGPALALDGGVTEVRASSAGGKYSQGYGRLLERLTRQAVQTGKARDKLLQVAKKAERKEKVGKAAGIGRNNLGRKSSG